MVNEPANYEAGEFANVGRLAIMADVVDAVGWFQTDISVNLAIRSLPIVELTRQG
jgi:hypothetical protein